MLFCYLSSRAGIAISNTQQSMCVCVHVHECVCVCAFVCVYMYEHVSVCVRACVLVHVCMWGESEGQNESTDSQNFGAPTLST